VDPPRRGALPAARHGPGRPVSTLARKPDAKAAAFEAEVEAGYRLLAVLREEVVSLRAELKRRQELEAKYSEDQLRIPK
jgi:hypothetical protein